MNQLSRTTSYLTAILLCAPLTVGATTLSHWQFEGNNFLQDSVGTSHLSLSGGVQQVDIPTTGRGSSFSPSAQAANFNNSNGSHLRTTIAPLGGTFTFEGLIHADNLSGQWGDSIVSVQTATNNAENLAAETAFSLQKRHDGLFGSLPGEMFVSLGYGSVFENVLSGLVMSAGIDYYFGVAVNTPAGLIDFFLKDLTNSGALLNNQVSMATAAGVNAITDLSFGDSLAFYDFAFDGLMDEVRLSNTALSRDQLLISTPPPPPPPTGHVPAPPTFWLVASVLLGMVWMRKRRQAAEPLKAQQLLVS